MIKQYTHAPNRMGSRPESFCNEPHIPQTLVLLLFELLSQSLLFTPLPSIGGLFFLFFTVSLDGLHDEEQVELVSVSAQS